MTEVLFAQVYMCTPFNCPPPSWHSWFFFRGCFIVFSLVLVICRAWINSASISSSCMAIKPDVVIYATAPSSYDVSTSFSAQFASSSVLECFSVFSCNSSAMWELASSVSSSVRSFILNFLIDADTSPHECFWAALWSRFLHTKQPRTSFIHKSVCLRWRNFGLVFCFARMRCFGANCVKHLFSSPPYFWPIT